MESSFGNWIKRRRKAIDLTQEQLAQRVGCSTSAIFKIEADERRPSRQVAELLAKHLEIPPDQHALFLKVARQEKGPGSLDEVPPLSDLIPAQFPVQKQSNLPVFPTQFVGREYEIDIITRQMQDPACRLMTLTGPGGVGKTRLAVEVARKLETLFTDGVFFLSMAAVNQPGSIIPVLADALGIVFSGPADPKLQVINALRNKMILLVFDNMEHLIAGSDVLGEILQQAPKVKLLLTSREQVHLQWEWIFDVQGLPVPEEVSASVLEANSAATIFLQRARQTASDFYLSSEDASALVHICKLVDGLPLAIELAASWVRVMSISEIALELERNMGLLETSLQDVPARHRSIKVVIDHSWDLLTDEERTLLMRLSVFSDGFTRKAAEAVAGASLLLLSSLVSKSLLQYSKKESRYDFHELICQYASTHLQVWLDEEGSILEKHSQYFSEWVASLEAPLKSAQQIQTSMQIRSETANWVSAWRWAVQHRRLDLLRRMIPCLYWYYEIHGYFTEALSSYKYAESELRAVGAPGNLSTPEDQISFAFLVDQLAWFTFRTGDTKQAANLFAESLQLVQDHQDQEVLFHIHGNWSYMALLSGNIDQAQTLVLAALTNAQALHAQWHIALATNLLGVIDLQRGKMDEAYQRLMDTLKVWRAVGDPRGVVFCMLYLGLAAFALEDTQTAEAVLSESNAIAKGKMDRWAQAVGLDLLGQGLITKGQIENAHDLLLQSLDLFQEIGDAWGTTKGLIHLGRVEAALGHPDEAKRLFRQAYLNAQQAKWAPTILEALFAFVTIQQEMLPETRLAVVYSILPHPAASVFVHQQAEHLRDQLSASLTVQQIESAQVQAAGLDPEQLDRDSFWTGVSLQIDQQATAGKTTG